MLAQPFKASTAQAASASSTATASRCGYATALYCSDGIGRFRRERSFAKALVDIKRLIIVSHEGAITLEALRWLNDAGITFMQIDRDGEANSGLRQLRSKRPAFASRSWLSRRPIRSGLEIARYVLSAKLAGQEMNLSRSAIPGKCPS